MLFVYGSLMPLRLLEEIYFWKTQEKEHTSVITAIIPNLEPNYVKLMHDWEHVFAKTEELAQEFLHKALESSLPLSPESTNQVELLLKASCQQSREFINQLYYIMNQSEAVQMIPLAKTVLLHIIRESEYFLDVLQRLTHAGINETTSHRTEEINAEQADEETRREPTWSDAMDSIATPVPIGGHRLPDLPYPYNALEPFIDETTMRIHHDKHHQSYVDGLNKAERALAEARAKGNYDFIKFWENELAFNGAGHYLHTIFWNIMSPNGGGKPAGLLAEQIVQDYSSYDQFKMQFSAAAEKVEGGGWAILVWSPRSQRTQILQAEKHQNLSQWDVIPLLPLDVWEHAYYLKYQNNRPKYIESWWNVVYWPAVTERYIRAKTLKWTPF